MCGIFGVALKAGAPVSAQSVRALLERLYLMSESRGKESAGLHLQLPERAQAWTIKSAQPASELLRSRELQSLLDEGLAAAYPDTGSAFPGGTPLIAIAHSRLVTNGTAALAQNNQPVCSGGVTIIHNGIIVNVDALWQANPHLVRQAEVDTEVMAAMLSEQMQRSFDPTEATRAVYARLRGAASVAWVHDESPVLLLGTNTGDLYYAALDGGYGIVFASERYILTRALSEAGAASPGLPAATAVQHLSAGHGLRTDLLGDGAPQLFPLALEAASPEAATHRRTPAVAHHAVTPNGPVKVFTPLLRPADETLLRYNEQAMRLLPRCTRCVLPDTFPFIAFDAQGVCNYCHGYQPKYRGVDAGQAQAEFVASLQRYRSADGSPDVLVPFSGGRDSCYGLHLIKTEFGLNPITFTYDWGMVTDLARRNVARLCGALGVQNILVSADIQTKRDNIRKNVSAWLKKPDLGLVPLFMAGDKHFFRIVNELKRQTGIRLDLWSANPLENTDFKSGFCGVPPDFGKSRVDYLSMSRKLRLAAYYGASFLGNPGYLNSSLADTATAFLSYYLEPRRDFFFMFSHMVWDERVVNDVLLNRYDFERSPDSSSTWRIGDGTAPFYNYIYLTARGFSEFDTFRSNQIREGQISRAEALESVLVENRPRTASLRWYLETIGLEFDETIRRINALDVVGMHR